MAWSSTGSRDRTGTTAHRAQRRRVFRRDGGRCQLTYPDICTGLAEELDHRENVASGGSTDTHDDGAVQAVCVACHKVKTQREAAAARRANRVARRIPTERHPGLL